MKPVTRHSGLVYSLKKTSKLNKVVDSFRISDILLLHMTISYRKRAESTNSACNTKEAYLRALKYKWNTTNILRIHSNENSIFRIQCLSKTPTGLDCEERKAN